MDRREHNSQCGACHSVVYCSKACQKEHWKSTHKQECKQLKQALEADMSAWQLGRQVPGVSLAKRETGHPLSAALQGVGPLPVSATQHAVGR